MPASPRPGSSGEAPTWCGLVAMPLQRALLMLSRCPLAARPLGFVWLTPTHLSRLARGARKLPPPSGSQCCPDVPLAPRQGVWMLCACRLGRAAAFPGPAAPPLSRRWRWKSLRRQSERFAGMAWSTRGTCCQVTAVQEQEHRDCMPRQLAVLAGPACCCLGKRLL